MRSLRFILAVMLIAGLAILPVAAATAMTHTAKVEMNMGDMGSDCPCCNSAHKCAPDTCLLKCFSVAATVVDGPHLTQPLPQLFLQIGALAPSPFSARPDP